ncbi:hypothetical protein DESUT3_03810 [Desulfuromonas versatilis]|uniref:Type 4 fimbrial biogenesis protein PilX N-terminal domain-containing protein n=2 Tax=Desulfuromonas versatilis TaxID=2802975 RepID=A0ABM8HS89_9BACT|nr:hypothetical protein DESUT3_03810 [Desulfuromonas versatilis]
MKKGKTPLGNERGAMLVIAVLVLALLTVIGMVATTTSTIELQIAANERNHQKAVYAAESGISHMVALLQSRLVEGNQANIASGNPPNWNFAIDGSHPDLASGFSRQLDGHFSYFTQIRDNDDESPNNPVADTDRLIFIQADGFGPEGATARVEVLVEAGLTGGSLSGYSAQAGGGSGKNSDANDTEAIQDTSSRDLGDI